VVELLRVAAGDGRLSPEELDDRLTLALGVPAATVRGWLRRLRERAGQMLQEATASFGRLVAVIETPEGRGPSPPGPTGSRLGDALALVAACGGRGQVARPGRGGPGGTGRRWAALIAAGAVALYAMHRSRLNAGGEQSARQPVAAPIQPECHSPGSAYEPYRGDPAGA
jgi:hypothetical protein